MDLVIRGSRLPLPGETILGGEFFQAPGGKGANQAVAAARAAQTSVAFIAAVGDDNFGKLSIDGFVADRLDVSEIRTIPDCATGIALILVDASGQNMISVASGANSRLAPADVDAVPDSLFQNARVFLCSLETPIETVRRGLERARDFGLTTILNPAPADRRILEGDLLSLVDILTPNETELSLLTGRPLPEGANSPDSSPIRAGALELQNRGCATVIATLGAEGCLVVADTVWSAAAFRVTAVDATAAGDAFNGALAVGLAEGRLLPDAVRFASAAAALSVTHSGAQPSLPPRFTIQRLLDLSADDRVSEGKNR